MNADLTNCSLCPRHCHADRTKGAGACAGGVMPRVARAALHFWEEPCISGTRGSGTVFFSGCPLKCIFCQNEKISHQNFGEEISSKKLAGIFQMLEDAGANNINLVTPTQWAASIREALDIYRPHIPILYNCSGYEDVDTLKMLEGYIDVYLPDIKYADPVLSGKFSGVPDYPDIAFSAVREMLRQKGNPVLNAEGILQKGVLIRHMVLPLHVRNTEMVLDRVAGEFGTDVWLSLLFQYTPVRHFSGYPELNRGLTGRERDRAFRYLTEKKLLNGYVQEPSSNSLSFIPDFDLTGVRT